MSLFSTILSKLRMGGATTASTPAPQRTPPSSASPPPTSAPAARPTVDVAAQLEQRAAANPEKLNWRVAANGGKVPQELLH